MEPFLENLELKFFSEIKNPRQLCRGFSSQCNCGMKLTMDGIATGSGIFFQFQFEIPPL